MACNYDSGRPVFRSFSILAAIVVVLMWATSARADVVVKDTLDPANFANIGGGGGFFAQSTANGSNIDGRTFLGFLPHQHGRLSDLRLNFMAIDASTGDAESQPGYSTLFDLSTALYSSLAGATTEPDRVDAFFSLDTQTSDIFENQVGVTGITPTNPELLPNATVFQAAYDLRPFDLAVTPGQANYLGISATGVPIGIGFQPQRSDDSGTVFGSVPDYLKGSVAPPGLHPMSDFYTDAIQNSVRITITNFGDARDGDYNGDGVVDAADFTVWRDNYGATSGPGLVADGNVDGLVDASDYAVWREYYGETVPGSAATGSLKVPEPTAYALIAFLLGLLVLTKTEDSCVCCPIPRPSQRTT